MKVAIIPDSAMLILNPVNKSKHQLLSEFDRIYKEGKNKEIIEEYKKDVHKSSEKTHTIEGINPYTGIKYCGYEAPSGVLGRMSKIGPIIDEADAVVMLTGNSPNHMYNTLNELILFGSSGCLNTLRLLESQIKSRKIPFLKLDYPDTREDLINIIDEENNFLKYLEDLETGKVNEPYKIKHEKVVCEDKISVNELEEILHLN
ncbi:DUF2112 family protein [uncultured Methanobrevibacter sp.]|uniref:DUF2112 family protein n=1 Tax=uncultured Methanobrevibacter sp. TaxID=253161 RepID=UPI0025EB915B|nr:DUF2112 family protein [uncultured Methanobrevibacter sp.]